jgi:hypothetical protein
MDIQPMECSTEEEARMAIAMMEKDGKWPCLFTKSDTTGEKDFEEFFTERELLDMNRFENLGIIKNSDNVEVDKINHFSESISAMKQNKNWTKEQLVTLFCDLLPDFQHKETGKYLDGKM